MRCGAGDRCLFLGLGDVDEELEEQYDPYTIYAGRWHETCWAKHGYGGFEFDAGYAGESLDEDY